MLELDYRVGYTLLAVIFLCAGLGKIFLWRFHVDVSSAAGIPFPVAAVLSSILIDAVGVLALISNRFVWQVSLVLSVYVLAVTWFFYLKGARFRQESYDQISQAAKNIAIMGGLILAAVNEYHQQFQ
jgi:uncharacterized membrane protein YphA (DoxX/SURF4 family)